MNQRYPYFGGYIQDDWRITRKLVRNLGLRYDVTLPPTNKKDEYSDFNPTRPNPRGDGYPGALWFAGFGPGRENARSLVPGWYGGIGPRIGVAYSPDQKTTIRSAFGRSFARVTAVSGSGHFAGFDHSISLRTRARVYSRRSSSTKVYPPMRYRRLSIRPSRTAIQWTGGRDGK